MPDPSSSQPQPPRYSRLSSEGDASTSGSGPVADASARPARADYEQNIAASQCQIDRLKAANFRLVWIRTGLFFLALVCLVLGYGGESYRTLLLSVGWLSAAAFMVAIVRHEHLRLERLRHESNQQLYQHLLARLDRDWQHIPSSSLLPEFSNLAYADDLDIAGSASLLGLLSLAQTYAGRQTLQSWLATAADWHEVQRRQRAVQALKPLREFRLKVIRTIRASGGGSQSEYGLPTWAKSPNWLPEHPVAQRLSQLGPTLAIIGLTVFVVAFSLESRSVANAAACVLGIGFLINVLVTVFWGSWIHDIFLKVTGEHSAVFQFANVFEAMAELPQAGPLLEIGQPRQSSDRGQESRTRQSESRSSNPELLDEIRHAAVESPNCATQGFAKLSTIVRLANFQRDPTLYIVYLILQLFLLWDFRILRLLEAWKTKFGDHVGHWFAALGKCESLISSSTLADEYPEWCFPSPLSDSAHCIEAQEVGHPLLADPKRVLNSLTLEAERPLLVVTGSNMAGKSTFLRAIGLNVVLARTGSPVCAEQLRMPVYELATSIRIRDSLRDGVSFFMAELNRLKEVVDLAKTHHERARSNHATPQILFLLDEILQGTNSQERQIAVASVLQQLLDSGAAGLISTHDLDLAHAEEVQEVSQVVHFREFFEAQGDKEVMRFDYRMRPGPTPTTNALKLLQLVGLHSETNRDP